MAAMKSFFIKRKLAKKGKGAEPTTPALDPVKDWNNKSDTTQRGGTGEELSLTFKMKSIFPHWS